MKNALISPNELRETGYRVAEISDTTFEVASPLFWVECVDDIVADAYWYDPINESFEVMPEPQIEVAPITADPNQPNTTGSQDL